MKKIISTIAIFVAIFGAVSAVPAQAEQKSLVIVDSYFDSRVGDVQVECLSGSLCSKIGRPSSSLTAPVNHGVAMVDAAKTAFPNVPIIALQVASATSEVNVGNLVVALEWAIDNQDKISALSISRKMNGTKHNRTGCDAASTNTAFLGGAIKADQRVRSLIAELKSLNIPVFVSTGNGRGNVVDYPACIADTESVSTGMVNKSGSIVSLNKFNDTTDYFVSLGNDKSNIAGNIFSLIPNTTSTATVLAAAKYVSESSLTKFISVLP